jgi:hypothetical protein
MSEETSFTAISLIAAYPSQPIAAANKGPIIKKMNFSKELAILTSFLTFHPKKRIAYKKM